MPIKLIYIPQSTRPNLAHIKLQLVLDPELFKTMQEDLGCMLAHVTSKVSITLDFWTSYQQIFYMSITSSCQGIDEL